jgi:hypothetical protein
MAKLRGMGYKKEKSTKKNRLENSKQSHKSINKKETNRSGTMVEVREENNRCK